MIQDFLQCPAGFYKRHILGEVDTKKSSALEYGTALHLGIRSILEGDDGVADFNLYWDSLKDTEMVYYRHGWQELRDLANTRFLPNFQKLHAKKYVDIKQELQMSMPFMGEHTLQGTLDCVGMYEGALTVSDWKSSTAEYKKNKIERNPQMYLYAKLYQHNYGVLPTQLVYKVFIKSEGRIQTLKKELTEQYLCNIISTVENTVHAMVHMIETKRVYHNHESCYCKEI